MKIIFFGTPGYVLPILEALNRSYKTTKEKGVIAVVTQPPKTAGRGNKLEYSEVDHWAYKKDIKILRDFDIKSFPEADLGVVAAYGKIIPQEIINKFKYGVLNIHPSLLPKYRGASPVQAALAMGEKVTGVTVIKMDEQIDHGPIVSQFKETVQEEDTTETLRRRLFERSAQFLIPLIFNYLNGKIKLKEQNHKEATFTKLIKKEDGFINPVHLNKLLDGERVDEKYTLRFIKDNEFDLTPASMIQLIKALTPWPGLWSNIKIQSYRDKELKRLKILKAHVHQSLTTRHQSFVLDTVQLEGKNPVTWEQFKSGYPNAGFE